METVRSSAAAMRGDIVKEDKKESNLEKKKEGKQMSRLHEKPFPEMDKILNLASSINYAEKKIGQRADLDSFLVANEIIHAYD